MTWRRTSPPPEIRRLLTREPGLCAAIMGWRSIEGVVVELVSMDRRGRYWIWRREWSDFVARDGDAPSGSGGHIGCFVMVPVYGPVDRARRRGETFEKSVRAALDALCEPETEPA